MRPTVAQPDAERAMVDVLTEALAAREPTTTVGIGVPIGWTPTSSPTHAEVAWDGTPGGQWPITARPTIRIVVRAASTTTAKATAALCQALLLAYEGGHGITTISPLVGITPARDPDTEAELAWFTVAVTTRLTPLA
jgi:hypothetical protein